MPKLKARCQELGITATGAKQVLADRLKACAPAAGATGRKRAAPAAAAAEESDAPAEREAKRGKAAAARAPSPQGRAEAKAKASGGNEPPTKKTKAVQPPLPEPSSEERAL